MGATTGTATFRNDFVELRNNGGADIALNGMALQHGAETSALAWTVINLPNVTLAAGRYYLVQLGSGGANGVVLDAPDHTAATNISATAGKVALTNNQVALVGPLDQPVETAAIIDLIGYGSAANAFEGARALSPSGVSTNLSSIARLNAGCIEGNNNLFDTSVILAASRNSQFVAPPCACTANETTTQAVNNPLEIDYCNLQHPPSTTTTVGVATEDIFSRVFEDGFTQAGGGNAAIKVQIGYGPPNVNPSFNQGAYTWTDAVFNVQIGNDDEYKAKLTVPAAGSFRYTSRVTRDNRNWTYCDLNGAGANAGLTFELPRIGALTVN